MQEMGILELGGPVFMAVAIARFPISGGSN